MYGPVKGNGIRDSKFQNGQTAAEIAEAAVVEAAAEARLEERCQKAVKLLRQNGFDDMADRLTKHNPGV